MARSLRSLRQVATLRHGHLARRFAPAFRALGICEHIWPFSLRDIWATLLSPKWAEIFVAQMAGDETSLPHLNLLELHGCSQGIEEPTLWVAVNRSNFSGRKDRGRTF